MANKNGNPANLLPWQPGQSGNLRGGLKNRPMITPALRRFLAMSALEVIALMSDEEAKAEMKLADVLALVMLEKAVKDKAWGDKAREEVLRRVDGAAIERLAEDEVAEGGINIIVVEAPLGFAKRRELG